MIEAVVAIAVLSVGAFAIHRTIQEAIRTRGQAQDFTRARFLLDQVISDLLIQPQLREEARSGSFSGEDARFSWQWSVRRVDPPAPRVPLKPPPKGAGPVTPIKYPDGTDYLAHVRVEIHWQRSGLPFSEPYETLLAPERLWQPPPLPASRP
jgi:hypothetical protein